MNSTSHTVFAEAIREENMTAWHLSLLSVLCHLQNNTHEGDGIPVTRRQLMSLSHIKSLGKYHECMKDLQRWGFIRYQPSYKPTGSIVHLLN
ncbi:MULTISPECIES: hypothetical protein [Chitinophagaceae]